MLLAVVVFVGAFFIVAPNPRLRITEVTEFTISEAT